MGLAGEEHIDSEDPESMVNVFWWSAERGCVNVVWLRSYDDSMLTWNVASSPEHLLELWGEYNSVPQRPRGHFAKWIVDRSRRESFWFYGPYLLLDADTDWFAGAPPRLQ